MPPIKTRDLVQRLNAGDYKNVRIIGLQNGRFYMVLDIDDSTLIHCNLDGSFKEYPKIDNAVKWLKRVSLVSNIVLDISLWNNDRKL